MTTSADWPQGVDPMPSMEPSSDLFDGDILGDELIDIYNAAVVGGGDDSMPEIPTLLAPTPGPVTDARSIITSPAVQSGMTPIDDGLGAFRPSTSFNDLSTLLPPTSNHNGNKGTKLTPVVSSTAISSKALDPKKRSNVSVDQPSPKRRSTGIRKNTNSSKGKAKATAGQNPGKQSNNTPNPLTSSGPPAVAATCGTQSYKPKQNVSKPPTVSVTAKPIVKDEEMSLDQSSPTEADFKSVAQAAVSNLIANAGNKNDAPKSTSPGKKEELQENVDTSTEHIKALTGNNWVSVCADGPNGGSAADKMNNRARRQNLTPDERARQNRDRNREHARNTRLRKKAYVEELKRTLTALVAQRDATEMEKRHTAQRELEQREVRFRVVEEFLKLRGRNEPNYARWAAILEENFTMTLPNTDYREMAVERGQFEQQLSGVSQVLADSRMFGSFLQGLGKVASGHSISFAYTCDRKNFLMDNCTAVLKWTAASYGAVHQGAPVELNLQGNLTAKFSPASNKLISIAMSFDTGIVLAQVNHIFKHIGSASNESSENDSAAQVAANEADAILDSLQMPHISSSLANKSSVLPVVSAASITDGENPDSSDESNDDVEDIEKSIEGQQTLQVRQD